MTEKKREIVAVQELNCSFRLARNQFGGNLMILNSCETVEGRKISVPEKDDTSPEAEKLRKGLLKPILVIGEGLEEMSPLMTRLVSKETDLVWAKVSLSFTGETNEYGAVAYVRLLVDNTKIYMDMQSEKIKASMKTMSTSAPKKINAFLDDLFGSEEEVVITQPEKKEVV